MFIIRIINRNNVGDNNDIYIIIYDKRKLWNVIFLSDELIKL